MEQLQLEEFQQQQKIEFMIEHLREYQVVTHDSEEAATEYTDNYEYVEYEYVD